MSNTLAFYQEVEAALVVVAETRKLHLIALDTGVDKYDTAWAWIHAKDTAKECCRSYVRACKKEGVDPQSHRTWGGFIV